MKPGCFFKVSLYLTAGSVNCVSGFSIFLKSWSHFPEKSFGLSCFQRIKHRRCSLISGFPYSSIKALTNSAFVAVSVAFAERRLSNAAQAAKIAATAAIKIGIDSHIVISLPSANEQAQQPGRLSDL
ncbi:MAG: hypothetical protein ACYC3X_29540 [Pirellulaceae bacterium]